MHETDNGLVPHPRHRLHCLNMHCNVLGATLFVANQFSSANVRFDHFNFNNLFIFNLVNLVNDQPSITFDHCGRIFLMHFSPHSFFVTSFVFGRIKNEFRSKHLALPVRCCSISISTKTGASIRINLIVVFPSRRIQSSSFKSSHSN